MTTARMEVAMPSLSCGNCSSPLPSFDGGIGRCWRGAAIALAAAAACLPAGRVSALDFTGPLNSVHFGTRVAVLPDGDIVVTDPDAASGAGAVYLYTTGGNLIGEVAGSLAADAVGSAGVVILANGDYVVLSPDWDAGRGAVTWMNGKGGAKIAVSSSNSLVGSTAGDQVGYAVVALSNGNYVVASPSWDNGMATDAGAVTWGSGSGTTTGAITSKNSLVGSASSDQIGSHGIIALGNGNYVVDSPHWNADSGAVTWGNGAGGTIGNVAAGNSLVGSQSGDDVGGEGVTRLSNDNYVVRSPNWDDGMVAGVGAATWGNGNGGTVGTVSAGNSLIGTTAFDGVGDSVTALHNGNYVVGSSFWHNGGTAEAGAATWGNGSTGTIGSISSANSLVGTTFGDEVGGTLALSNGNYAVVSPLWDNGSATDVGAVTWGNGSGGTAGEISTANSLVGATNGDQVGRAAALTNGNYVVTSPSWDDGGTADVGAVTWCNGNSATVGTVSQANSLIGTTAGDNVGQFLVALTNGNYVVASENWSDGNANVGAVTRGDGNAGTVGVVSTSNSLVGSATNDAVGSGGPFALANGNYVVASPFWNDGAKTTVGAVTLGLGNGSTVGAVAAGNSLIGKTSNDVIGWDFGASGLVFAQSNGDYVVESPYWDNASIVDAGAVTLRRGHDPLGATIGSGNSVRGLAAGGGASMSFAYDATRDVLIVGRPAENIVTVFKADLLFRDGFE